MRNFLAILGGVFLVVIVLVVIGIVFAVRMVTTTLLPTIEEAQAYADETLAAYSEEWSSDVILSRSTPQLRTLFTTNPEILESMHGYLTEDFGALVSLAPAACPNVRISNTTQTGHSAVAGCTANAVFEAGEALFRLSLLKNDDEWGLTGIYVQSDVLLTLARPSSTSSADENVETESEDPVAPPLFNAPQDDAPAPASTLVAFHTRHGGARALENGATIAVSFERPAIILATGAAPADHTASLVGIDLRRRMLTEAADAHR